MNTDKKYRLLKEVLNYSTGHIIPIGEVFIQLQGTRKYQSLNGWQMSEAACLNKDWFEEVLPELSKQPPIGKDWEIVEAKNSVGEIHQYIKKTCDSALPKCTIHSVRRISDGEVFSGNDITNVGTISHFEIDKETMFAHFLNSTHAAPIEYIQKLSPSPKPQEDKEPEAKSMNTTQAYNEGYMAGVRHCVRYGIPTHVPSSQSSNEKGEDKRIEVNRIERHDTLKGNKWDSFFYQFCSSNSIPKDKFPAIKSAIENVLNGERRVYSQGQVDAMMEKVFNASREYYGYHAGLFDNFIYKTFEDYRKSTTEPAPSIQEEKKEVLFTTEDGVKYHKGEKKEIWGVHTKEGYNAVGAYHPDVHPEYYEGLKAHYDHFFSTENAANNWILENKPCLSLNDVKEWVSKYLKGATADFTSLRQKLNP